MRKLLLSILIVGALLAALPTLTYAGAASRAELVVSPAFISMDLDPGESESVTLTIVNTSDVDRTLEVKLRSFNEGGSIGEPVLDDSIVTPLHGWVDLESNRITVPAHQHIEFSVSVNIPLHATPSSYRTTLLFRDTQVQITEDGSVAVAESGPLLFVEVNGKVVELADVIQFAAKDYINEGLPVTFNTLISNQGNVDIVPVGTINIIPIYSLNSEKRNFDFNPTLSLTLADSQRSYTSLWIDQPNWQIGYYEAELVFAYSDSNKVVTAKTNFWIIPWKLIIIILIVTIGTAIAYRKRRRPKATPKPRAQRTKLNVNK